MMFHVSNGGTLRRPVFDQIESDGTGSSCVGTKLINLSLRGDASEHPAQRRQAGAQSRSGGKSARSTSRTLSFAAVFLRSRASVGTKRSAIPGHGHDV